jgi:hypothetical protein
VVNGGSGSRVEGREVPEGLGKQHGEGGGGAEGVSGVEVDDRLSASARQVAREELTSQTSKTGDLGDLFGNIKERIVWDR